MKGSFASLLVLAACLLVGVPGRDQVAAASAKTGQVLHASGTVVSVNDATHTLVLKDTVKGKARERSFGIDKDTMAEFSKVKPGEQIKVEYVRANGHLTVRSITPASQTAAK